MARPLARFQALILSLQVGHHGGKIETFLKKLSALAKVRLDLPLLSISLKFMRKTAVTPHAVIRYSQNAGKICPLQAADLEIRGSKCRNRTSLELGRKPFDSLLVVGTRSKLFSERVGLLTHESATAVLRRTVEKPHVLSEETAVWSLLQQLAPRTHLIFAASG